MKLMNKLERRFGKYAIRNLPLIMIAMEAIGYILSVVAPNVLNVLCFDPFAISSGQVWRLVTWVLMPPSSLNILTVIMLFFYYWIARMLASTWGDFYFNVYLFGGIVITDIGMMILYAVLQAMSGPTSGINLMIFPMYVNLYYIQTTVLLAFAFTYPNAQVLLYFFIPIKMSWLGIFEGIMLVWDFIRVKYMTPRMAILLAVLNLVLYFLMTKDLRRFSPKEFARRSNYRKATGQGGGFFSSFGSGKSRGNASSPGTAGERGPFGAGGNTQRPGASTSRRSAGDFTKIYPNGARHRCTVCGRTELDDERLEFRFCSKCEGSHEYCQDHLFTHQHIRNGVPGGTPEGGQS